MNHPSISKNTTLKNASLKYTARLLSASALALACVGAASAQDIFWSIGMSSPGVQVGVSNAPPVVVYPQPVVVQRPMVVAPRPVVVQSQPVIYVQSAPLMLPTAHVEYRGWKHGHGHGKHRGWDRDERSFDRHDRRSDH